MSQLISFSNHSVHFLNRVNFWYLKIYKCPYIDQVVGFRRYGKKTICVSFFSWFLNIYWTFLHRCSWSSSRSSFLSGLHTAISCINLTLNSSNMHDPAYYSAFENSHYNWLIKHCSQPCLCSLFMFLLEPLICTFNFPFK